MVYRFGKGDAIREIRSLLNGSSTIKKSDLQHVVDIGGYAAANWNDPKFIAGMEHGMILAFAMAFAVEKAEIEGRLNDPNKIDFTKKNWKQGRQRVKLKVKDKAEW